MSGWIKLHRKIQDHWVFSFDEPDKTLAFIDIVLSASYTDNVVMIKGRTYHVKRGQFLVSQATLQKRWKWSQNKVSRFLNLLKKEGVIDLLTDERTSIISVCNYSEYQSGESAGERTNERSGEHTSNDQSNDTIRSKELKEGKELKKIDSQQADESQQIFEYWCLVMQKNGSAKFTADRKRAVKARLKEGYTIDHIKQAIDGCARSDWHMARDGRNTTKYDDLELICRNGSQIEKLAMNIGAGSLVSGIINGQQEFLQDEQF